MKTSKMGRFYAHMCSKSSYINTHMLEWPKKLVCHIVSILTGRNLILTTLYIVLRDLLSPGIPPDRGVYMPIYLKQIIPTNPKIYMSEQKILF